MTTRMMTMMMTMVMMMMMKLMMTTHWSYTDQLVTLFPIPVESCFLCSYGDRTAVSALGRVVGITWTLIGLVLNGILVSALATALTSVSKQGARHQLYGSTVRGNYCTNSTAQR